MEQSPIEIEQRQAVVKITLNRPRTYNAFDFSMGRELLGALQNASHRGDVRAVILTGHGKAFCSGGDVQAMARFMEEGNDPPLVFFRDLTHYLHSIVVEMRLMAKPIVAAVNGVAAGAGFSLALACDIILASSEARFTQAYTRLGLVPDGGSTYFLPRLVGPAKAAELAMLNPMISAEEALGLGIINRVVPHERLDQEAWQTALELANGPTLAYGRLKQLLLHSWGNTLETQLEMERRAIMSSSMTKDFREGVQAFLTKRKPDFSGR
jgi:2-(1,2-epoxy-1,2-dihydrophenyl)acetyl-CoA isomerase